MRSLSLVCLVVLALVAVGCSKDVGSQVVDYRSLLAPDGSTDRQRMKDAKMKCAAASDADKAKEPWCNAVRKAAGCAGRGICPES
jgi:hypothetical protein